MALIKPLALHPGDTIGVIAPASRSIHPSAVTNGIRTLESFGFSTKPGRHIMNRHGYFAGTDEERLTDLQEMFEDPTVNGIICVRGGYGCARLLSRIDYDCIRANPKVFVGYSDITSLHIAFLKCADLVSFWGPMVASEMGKTPFYDYNRDGLLRAITMSEPIGEIRNPPGLPPIQTINGGIAEGTLIGGTLSLITATLGTPYEIETDGTILFFEEVGEEPHRIDRMLNQLLLSGKFDGVAGVVIGECKGCESRTHEPAFPNGGFSIEEVFDDIFGRLGVPVIYGLCIGHGAYKSTLPIGVKATLDADCGVLRIDESGVIAPVSGKST